MTPIAACVRQSRSSLHAIRPPVLVALALSALAIAVAAGWICHASLMGDPTPQAFDGFRKVREKTIQAQLDQVEGPYIVVLGDSHAERLYLPTLCGFPVVNAGLSGARLSDVLDLARKITPPRKAQAVLLSAGTNDIWLKRDPETADAQRSFRAGLAALRDRLAAWSGRRALIAIPPVASKEEALFPPAAATRYSAMLAQSCEPESCLYLDLYGAPADIRRPRPAFSDGVHLRDYARFVRARETEICRRLGIPAMQENLSASAEAVPSRPAGHASERQ